MAKSQDTELLTRIAWMYYYGKMNHEDIAKELGLSRIKVTRLLKTAHEAGIVEIKIRSENASLFSLEAAMKERTGLAYCIVVPSIADLDDSLCRGTAHLFNDIVTCTGSLGVGLSRTLKNVSRYIEKEKNSL
jgi:DNA-binding transcriptional regulator LsrR (DeoR family)